MNYNLRTIKANYSFSHVLASKGKCSFTFLLRRPAGSQLEIFSRLHLVSLSPPVIFYSSCITLKVNFILTLHILFSFQEKFCLRVGGVFKVAFGVSISSCHILQ